jgi:hypothetical protein
MTSKKDFTDEEWKRIRRAPLVAGVAISLADPGGPIEVAKETMASVALDVQALAQQKQNPLGDFKPTNGQVVLDELRSVNEIVTAKASSQEVEAFRRWLVAAAQAAADAAKEGGFMVSRTCRIPRSAAHRQSRRVKSAVMRSRALCGPWIRSTGHATRRSYCSDAWLRVQGHDSVDLIPKQDVS